MSHSNFVRTALILTFAVAASGGIVAGAPIDVLAPVAASRFAPATLDISGRYDGTVNDSVFGSGEIVGDLAQYQGAVSGTVEFIFGSLENITPAAFLLNGTSLSGSGVFVNTYGQLCPTSVTASYTGSRNLKGSYKVTNGGCSSSAGTFTMKHLCSYREGPIEPNRTLKRC